MITTLKRVPQLFVVLAPDKITTPHKNTHLSTIDPITCNVSSTNVSTVSDRILCRMRVFRALPPPPKCRLCATPPLRCSNEGAPPPLVPPRPPLPPLPPKADAMEYGAAVWLLLLLDEGTLSLHKHTPIANIRYIYIFATLGIRGWRILYMALCLFVCCVCFVFVYTLDLRVRICAPIPNLNGLAACWTYCSTYA